MNRDSIDRWLERVILVLVAAILVFTPMALGGVRPSELVFVRWMFVALIGIWLVRLWVAPKYRFLLPPTVWAGFPFIIYAVWRYRTADIEYLARQEFLLALMAFTLILAIVTNLHGQNELRVLAIALVTGATLIAMYGIYQWLTGSEKVWHFQRPAYEGRASGTYISPNHYAGFLEMVCPLALIFALMRGFSPVARIFLSYAALVILIGIAASGSRGGWLSMGVAAVLLGLVLIRSRGHLWAALALLLIVGGTGTWLYARILKPRIEHQAKTAPADDLRVRLWGATGRMWADHPWVGVGPGHFDDRFRGYRPEHWQFQPRPGWAHNDYLNALADWGLVGFLLMLVPLGVTLFGAAYIWRYLRRRGETTGVRAGLVLAATGGLVAILVHSVFDFNLHIPANLFLAAALVAVIASHWRFASQRYWVTARWGVAVIATVILGTIGLYFFQQASRLTSEVKALKEAERAEHGSAARLAALEKAFKAEPLNPATAFGVGEQYWSRAMMGETNQQQLAQVALEWFEKTQRLNRWDPQAWMRAGMCLDWLERFPEAERCFAQALKLDPNHWQTRGMMGWHYFQVENYAETIRWMEHSLKVEGAANSLAISYLELAKKLMAPSPGGSR